MNDSACEKFEDAKGVTRHRKSKKNRQHNDEKEEDKYNTLQNTKVWTT